MIRYVVFDTETTGLDPFSGDKIIEIGAVELLDKTRSGKIYHQLVNPERHILQETTDITHITNEMVANQPTFTAIADDFLAFLNDKSSGCEKTFLVAHNASFDIKFLNYELKLTGREGLSSFEVIDTLELARKKFPNQKATLDLLCERFGISLEERKREGHGALLDSQILVDVFLKLTEGSFAMSKQDDNIDFIGFKKRTNVLQSRKFTLSNEELDAHVKFLQENNIESF